MVRWEPSENGDTARGYVPQISIRKWGYGRDLSECIPNGASHGSHGSKAQGGSTRGQALPPKFGHLYAGHAPDKTYTDPGKADSMASDTYRALLQAGGQIGTPHSDH
jgi:hypothetical protein